MQPVVLNFVSTTTGSTVTLSSRSSHQIEWDPSDQVSVHLRFIRGNIEAASPPALAGTAAPLGVYIRLYNSSASHEHYIHQENLQRGVFVPFLRVTTLSTNAFCNAVSSEFPSGLFVGHYRSNLTPRDWKVELFDESGAPLSFTQVALRVELVPASGKFKSMSAY